MVFKYAFLFPIMVFFWFIFTFVSVYISAVLRQDVVPVFPYISDTGTWPPESCFFGIMLTIGAIFLLSTVYVRYRQIKYYCRKNDFGSIVTICNNLSVCVACFSALGVVLVGNFQETNALRIHIIGAQFAFVGAIIWQILQVGISFYVFPVVGNKTVNKFRAVCTVMCIVLFILVNEFGTLSFTEFRGKDFTKWVRSDGGYDYHLVSSITEWLMIGSYGLFIISLTKEFYGLSFMEPEIILNET